MKLVSAMRMQFISQQTDSACGQKQKEITLDNLKGFVCKVKAKGLRAYLAVTTVNENQLTDVQEIIAAALAAK